MVKLNFYPIDKGETAQDKAYLRIKNAILNEDIDSNTIFTETQLAESFQISRTPVRAAVQDLIKEGLIVSVPRKGLMPREVTVSEQEEIFSLRKAVEVVVLQRVTKVFNAESSAKLNKIVDKQEIALSDDDKIKFIDLDQEFHLTLSELAGYNIIEQVLYNLHNLTQLMGLKAVSKKGRMQEVIMEHRQIITALENKDDKAISALILDHLEKTRKSIEEKEIL